MRIPVSVKIPVVSGKMLPDNIMVFEVGETGVKTHLNESLNHV